ncbi:MAG: sugar-transfer associated ATP-grasp domain-containing protein, partial [Pseudomonadota bacterium]
MTRLIRLWARMRAARHHRSMLGQVFDWMTHRFLLRVTARDYYRFEFFDPQYSWSDKKRYICPGGSVYWPYENIPRKFSSMLSNKYIQKHLLLGFGLPTPKLLETVGSQFNVRTREHFQCTVDAIEGDFLLKPVNGSHGSHILVIEKTGTGLRCGSRDVTADELWEAVYQRFDSGFLLERRVTNVDYIREIFPGCLNTFRVNMVRTDDNQWHVVSSGLKMGKGDCQVDNTHAGGLWIDLDDRGVGVQFHGDAIAQHPETGVQLLGRQFDGYEELTALAIRACEKFGVLGTVGWDIAHTTEGFQIIEGNTLWGPETIPLVTDEIAANLKYHGPFTSWK